jgi:peptidoglycan/LPS O-acetylase OafA/YrhL
MQDRAERFAALDGIRAVACFLVVAHHAPDLFPWLPSPSNAYLAVDLFFCLSGFVIASTYGARLRSGELSAGRFLVSRAIRFYPLYILGLALGIPRVLAAWHGTAPGALVAVFLSPELLYIPTPGLPYAFALNIPAWSLSAELLVNGVYAWLASRQPTIWWLLTPISLLAVWSHAAIAGNADVGSTFAMLTIGWARATLMFSIGVLVQRTLRIQPLRSNFIVAAILIAVAVALGTLRQPALSAVAVTTVACPIVIYFAARVSPLGALRAILLLLGQLSYGVYILHQGPLELIRIYFASTGLTQTAAEILGIALMAVLCVTVWLLERYYVPPARRLLLGAVDYLARRPRLGRAETSV